jgi:4-amino-4-deoxy-L-arabinose transferase-like glycosyltransferase
MILCIACLAWTLLNLFLAGYTTLFDDEALFWMYSTRPAWGYYEHPPMVGMLIRLGAMLFSGELGVRLIFVILNTVSLILIVITLRATNIPLLIALSVSLAAFSMSGFMAAPDPALAFWISLYLYLYRKFTEQPHWITAVIWGVVMAAMMYSKYNAILVIILTLASNLRLFRQRLFYLAALIALLAFLPHVIWLWQNNFSTVMYHLSGRSDVGGFRWNNLGDFILGQLLLLGPFMWIFILWGCLFFHPSGTFDRSLMWIFWGIMIFFTVYLLKSRVEANWTAPAFLPAIMIAYRYFENRSIRVHRWIYITALVSFTGITLFRINLISSFIPLPSGSFLLRELKHGKAWDDRMNRLSQEYPAVFISSYQWPSKMRFYTANPSYSLCAYNYHLTQFVFWPEMEEELQGRTVMLMAETPEFNKPYTTVHRFDDQLVFYRTRLDHFLSFYTLPVIPEQKSYTTKPGDSLQAVISLINNRKELIRFSGNRFPETWVVYHLMKEDHFIVEEKPVLRLTESLNPGDTLRLRVQVPPVPEKGNFTIMFSLKTGDLISTRNGIFTPWKAE